MPTFEVKGPNGEVYEVDAPEGATEQDAIAQVQKQGGDDSRTRGFVLGALKPLDNAARYVSHLPGMEAVDRLGQNLGLLSAAKASSQRDAMRGANARTGYQILGNMVGTAPLAAVPGGALAQGAASGALLSDKEDARGIVGDMAIGAVGSKVGSAIGNTVGGLIAPAVTKGQQALYRMGVDLTPGQIGQALGSTGGKIVSGIESVARRLPGAKQLVAGAERRGQEQYYRGILKRTGVDVPENVPLGHEAHNYIGRKLSSQYESLLPKLQVSADPKLVKGLSEIEGTLKNVIPENFDQFQGVLKEAQLRGTKGIALDGRKLQHADRVLRTYAEKFNRSGDPNQRIMGAAFEQIRQQFRSLNMRQNPQHAKELANLNKNWRELALARKAAGDENNLSGIFTPAQYSRAAKGSRSNAETTRTANMLLTNRSPDSGTAESLGALDIAGLSAMGSGGMAAAPWVAANPVVPASLGAAALLYTKRGQQLLNKLMMAPRKKSTEAVAKGVRKAGELAPFWAAPPLLARPDR